MHSVRFITLGCRLNQAEEAVFAGAFAARGWRIVFDDAPADAVVLHSCAVTRQAERATLQTLRALKHGAKPPFVAVAGCATAALPEMVLEEAGADLVVQVRDPQVLCDLLCRLVESNAIPSSPQAAPCLFPGKPNDPDNNALPVPAPAPLPREPAPEPLFRHPEKALLKIQDGCDFRCAYCIVPFTRGPSVSFPFDNLVAAAQRMADRGAREIVLTGCNLACYHDGGHDLADLAAKVCNAVAGQGAVVSLGSVEPAICDRRIIDAMLAHANFKRFVHLPIQSGDSRVLALARRKYTGEGIRNVLSLYRESVPRLVLGADFITGLPGEDETAFKKTEGLVRDFAFDLVHVFPYSPRRGTAALNLPERPSRSVAKERAARLRTVANQAHATSPRA